MNKLTSRKRITINIISNWGNLLISIIIAFIVSPILINTLGNETYGIWVLIISITSYFSILDFGVNSAIVRYVSKYFAQNKMEKLNAIYSNAFVFFALMSMIAFLISITFAYYFKDIFNIDSFSQEYLFYVFVLVGLDVSINLLFSVFLGTIKGLQRFYEANIITIGINIIKNLALVYFLTSGYSLFTISMLFLISNIMKLLLQFILIKNFEFNIAFSTKCIKKKTLRKLYDYSLYSFIITIAIKIIFYTDSVIIGNLISVGKIPFYSIPNMILEYLQQFVWALVAVLVPFISAANATGNTKGNARLYIIGTKYIFLFCTPIIIVLLNAGDDFIRLWIGKEYADQSGIVLSILLTGYIFFLAQLLAHGILKGLSKHKYLALILCFEAVANLIISVLLAPLYGIIGVAFGTIIPLVIINLFVLPYYTCHVLQVEFKSYFIKAYLKPVLSLLIILYLTFKFDFKINNYLDLILFSFSIALIYSVYAFIFHIEKDHKKLLIKKLYSQNISL